MITTLNQKRAQSTVEYVILIVVIIGALIAIQVYIKRGVTGRLKGAADDIGDQYSPNNTNVIRRSSTKSKSEQRFGYADGGTTTAKQGHSSTKMIYDNTVTNEQAAIVNNQFEQWQ